MESLHVAGRPGPRPIAECLLATGPSAVARVFGFVVLMAFLVSCGRRPPVSPDPCATDVAPPSPAAFHAEAGPASINLTWRNPESPIGGVRLLRRVGSYPTSPTDSEAMLVYEGLGSSATDTALALGASYQYTLWSYSPCSPRQYSLSSTSGHASPFRPGPPAPPSNLLARPGPHSLQLSWTNPSGGIYQRTVVRRGSTGFPLAPSDGILAFDGAATSFEDTGLSPLQTYYYSLFTVDVYEQWSSAPSQVSSKPDWEYRDFVVPQLRIAERFPTQRCGTGDCDFRAGPTVTLTAQIQRSYLTFWVEVIEFRAAEVSVPDADTTCIEKSPGDVWASNTHTLPFEEGWIFHGYPGISSVETIRYTDKTFTPDVVSGSQIVDYAVIVGSTNGADICGMTEDDTHLHDLRTRPLVVRMRR